jgi:OmpA-OmpF porin, OOP family
MKRAFFIFALVLFVNGSALAQRGLKDFAGAKDPALFTRMPNFYMTNPSCMILREFDSYAFWVNGPKTGERKPIEGRSSSYKYIFDAASGSPVSALQIVRNYQNAAAPLGGKILYDNGRLTTIMIAKGGGETWIEVASVPTASEYTLKIIERQSMQQAVTADAAAFQAGLATSGHVEVPGIFFDTGKSEVKPESEPALKEVVKLLQSNPGLKVWVVGHTDNTGGEELNVSLSQARAAAVVKMLVQQMGVDAARLAAHGAGPYAPVAENKTEEGRAKNRRVELVARQ